METTAVPQKRQDEKPAEMTQFVGGLGFDWAMIGVCSWLLSGGYLDAWAHNHIQLETFFTPWHAFLYSGFLAVAFTLIGTLIFNRVQGYSWQHALPRGYGLSMIGVIFFALGGVGDMFWHLLFGIELNVDAALSPTHILLAVCFVLIVGGPFRAAWQRSSTVKPELITFLPTILSLVLILSVFTLITQFAHPFVLLSPANPEEMSYDGHALGVVSIVFQTIILMGLILLAMRRWRLPFGTFTIVFTLNIVLLSFMRDHYFLIPFALAAGFIADVLLWRLKPSTMRIDALRIFAFAVPVELYLLYFLALQLTVGMQWIIHLWLGSTVAAGIFGLLISYLLVPPHIPEGQSNIKTS